MPDDANVQTSDVPRGLGFTLEGDCYEALRHLEIISDRKRYFTAAEVADDLGIVRMQAYDALGRLQKKGLVKRAAGHFMRLDGPHV